MKVPMTFMRRKPLGTTQCLNKWLCVHGLLVCGLSGKMENNSSITNIFFLKKKWLTLQSLTFKKKWLASHNKKGLAR